MRWKARAGVGVGVMLLSPLPALAATYYVAPAPTGSDGNPGTTMAAPFATFARAQTAAAAGDTVFFRGGTYSYTDANTADAAGDAVNLSKSGTSANRINYWAYQNEIPVFDFAGIKAQVRIKGFNVTGSWLHLRGLEIKGVPQNTTTNHESWGIYNNGGNNNIYELLNLHHNMGPGFFLNAGGNNHILNCDSHHNYDPNSSTGPGTNADGFGSHVGTADTGNVFSGCRAWWNSDDGWDFIQAQVPVTVENSWAWYNGYYPDSTNIASGGDGNGFKGGGYGVPATNVPANPPSHTVRFCVGFLNRASGFNANHHPVADFWYNNSAFNNNASDFNMTGLLTSGVVVGVGTLRNNIAYGGLITLNPSMDAAFNSWTLPVTVSDADFQSLSIAGMDGPRQTDGSLPNVPFMKLRPDSDLIDKGMNVGLPFSGVAPDLGAFEAGASGSGGSGSNGTGGRGAGGGGGFAGGTGGTGFGSGGSVGSGGATGADGSGGSTGTGGVVVVGGSGGSATGGVTVVGTGGDGAVTATGGSSPTGRSTGGANGTNGPAATGAGGCSCRTSRDGDNLSGLVLFWSLPFLIARRRIRSQRDPNGIRNASDGDHRLTRRRSARA